MFDIWLWILALVASNMDTAKSDNIFCDAIGRSLGYKTFLDQKI